MPDNIFQKYLSLGLSVIPVRSKICQLPSWKQYQTKAAEISEAENWSGDVACICGKISGGIVCADFDVKNGDKYSDWLNILLEYKPELPSKLVIEKTPSGGYHVIFKSNQIIKNIKLACNKDGAATIETRGEGGYFVCAPSQNYEFTYGNFDKISLLTSEETDFILTAAMSLNEKIEEKKEPVISSNSSGITPFDDYNIRHDVSGLLQSHGWKLLFTKNQIGYFQRPGKEGRGISATWGAVPERFYVFSTATNFENNHIYKASAIYAILEHNGNYSEAAKALFEKGYGKKTDQQTATILNTDSIREKLINIYNYGYKKGNTTGWKNLDSHYSVIKGQFTVVTGMPSCGKSEFMDAMMMNLAINEGWKFGIFAPENYPVEMHYHKLIEKKIKKPFLNTSNRMSILEMDEAIKFINSHFFFIDASENEINLEAILTKAQELINEKHIDGLCLDPWNEIEMDKPKELSTTEYVAKSLRISRKFARRNKIHLWVVVHPTKIQKDKNGEYPVPELYDCEGSAHWRNKADNGICVDRRDFSTGIVDIHIQKIKYRYTGEPGLISLKYNKINGTYEECAKF